MPLINVQVIDNVFTPEQKQAIAEATMANDGEARRPVTWLMIDEVPEDIRLLSAGEIQDLQRTFRPRDRINESFLSRTRPPEC